MLARHVTASLMVQQLYHPSKSRGGARLYVDHTQVTNIVRPSQTALDKRVVCVCRLIQPASKALTGCSSTTHQPFRYTTNLDHGFHARACVCVFYRDCRVWGGAGGGPPPTCPVAAEEVFPAVSPPSRALGGLDFPTMLPTLNMLLLLYFACRRSRSSA